jgi:hypothetical protein
LIEAKYKVDRSVIVQALKDNVYDDIAAIYYLLYYEKETRGRIEADSPTSSSSGGLPSPTEKALQRLLLWVESKKMLQLQTMVKIRLRLLEDQPPRNNQRPVVVVGSQSVLNRKCRKWPKKMRKQQSYFPNYMAITSPLLNLQLELPQPLHRRVNNALDLRNRDLLMVLELPLIQTECQ